MSSSTASSHSHSPPSHSTSPTIDEHTALLPHEIGPALEAQPSSSPHTDSPPVMHTPDRPNNQHIAERLAELEHIISRIDTIEIGLWQTRLAREHPPLTSTSTDEERLSRVSTYIDRVASRHKSLNPRSSIISQNPNRYFWVDVLGISMLGVLVAGMLLFVGVSLLRGGRLCGEDGDMGVFVCVQALVSMGFGLLTEVPNRWVVPFVLPLWVIGVVGTMLLLQGLTCRS